MWKSAQEYFLIAEGHFLFDEMFVDTNVFGDKAENVVTSTFGGGRLQNEIRKKEDCPIRILTRC